jgi:hypothetical protein
LRLLYGDAASLEAGPNLPKGFLARIVLPDLGAADRPARQDASTRSTDRGEVAASTGPVPSERATVKPL